jgi:DNA polymerase III epsilon subunit family exonuclease
MFISLDLETTGFDKEKDQIIEFGAIKFDLNGNREEKSFLINPEVAIPPVVQYITNISDEDVASAPLFAEKKDEIIEFVGDFPIIGHNIQFDTGFLKSKGIPLTNKEYDTQDLSCMVLQDLPSFSLEVISQVLDLTHEDKHRALDDAKAAMELFLELLKQFQKLPAEELKQVQAIAEKSGWDCKDLILSLESDPNVKVHSINREKISDPKHVVSEEAVAEILNGKEKIYHFIPPFNAMVEKLTTKVSPDTYVSLPQNLFTKIEHKLPENIAKINNYQSYLSPEKLKKFIAQENLAKFEATAAIKYFLWQSRTKTGLMSEIPLYGKETYTRNKVAVDKFLEDPKKEPFIAKALEKDKTTPAVCTHQYLLKHSLPEDSKVVIFDFGSFLKAIKREHSQRISLNNCLSPLAEIKKLLNEDEISEVEALETKLDMLFGLVGIIFDQSKSKTNHNAISLNNMHLSGQKWLQIKEIVKQIIDISHKLGPIVKPETTHFLASFKNRLEALNQIFLETNIQDYLLLLSTNQKEEITVHYLPRRTDELVEETLTKFADYKIIEETPHLLDYLPGKNPNVIDLTSKIDNLEINIIDEDIDESNFSKIAQQIYEEEEKRIVIITNSKKRLKNYTLELFERGETIISQLTGSRGKINEKFRQSLQNEKKTLVALTPSGWDRFGYQDKVDLLIIDKIPFDPPSSPEVIAASEKKENPFLEVHLPRAIAKLQKVISKFKVRSQASEVLILDQRLVKNKYGKNVIKELEKIAKVKVTTI